MQQYAGLVIRKRVPAGAPAGARSYRKHRLLMGYRVEFHDWSNLSTILTEATDIQYITELHF